MSKTKIIRMLIAVILMSVSLSQCSQTGMSQKKQPFRIGIVVFEGFLTSEVTAPIEVFNNPEKPDKGETPFEVLLVAEKLSQVTSHQGLKIIPDKTFDNCPPLNALIVPSSYNLKASENNDKVIAFVKDRGKKVKYLASNCAGAFILGKAGLIDGKKVTTYVGGGKLLQKRFPKAIVNNDADFVVDGNLITSNGILISYKASLELLKMIKGEKRAKEIADNLYYTKLLNRK